MDYPQRSPTSFFFTLSSVRDLCSGVGRSLDYCLVFVTHLKAHLHCDR